MQPVNDFHDVLQKQLSLACDLADLDGYFSDVEPAEWDLQRAKNRRGWTQQDLRFHCEMARNAQRDPFNLEWHFVSRKHPSTTRPCRRRLKIGFRQLSSLKPKSVLEACSSAVIYCNHRPHFANLSGLIVEITKAHLEWIEWIQNNEGSDVAQRLDSLWCEFRGCCKILSQVNVVDRRDEIVEAGLPLSEESKRLLASMLTFKAGERVTAAELRAADEMAFRGDTTEPSIATRLKRLREDLPKDAYQFKVHESGSYGFTWIKKPNS